MVKLWVVFFWDRLTEERKGQIDPWWDSVDLKEMNVKKYPKGELC